MPKTSSHADNLRLLLPWLPSLLWAGVIFSASAVPGSKIPGHFGNLAHVAEYMIFAALLSVPISRGRSLWRAATIALLIASAYGITDEIHQAFVPMRTPDVADWGRDTLGALIGVSLIAWARHRMAVRQQAQHSAPR